jgi:hypothetical protein
MGGLGERADQATVERRLDYLYQELLRGERPTQLVQFASVNWNVTTRQVWNYIKRVNTIIKKEAEKYRASAFEEHLMTRRRLRKEANDFGERRLELEVLKDEAKLLDLYPSGKLELSGSVESKVEHDISSDTAETIFDILASVGAVPSALDDAEDDEIHTAPTD